MVLRHATQQTKMHVGTSHSLTRILHSVKGKEDCVGRHDGCAAVAVSNICMAEPENDAHHALLAGIANEASSGDDTAVEAASAEASEAASEDVAVASEAAAEAVSEGAEAAPEDERLQCAAAAQFTLLAGEEAVAEVDFTGEVSWEALVLDEAPHFDIDVRVTCRSFDAPDDWQ
eukprot:1416681-Amphidinium_carterae.1